MKALYKPFGLLVSVAAGLLGRRLFTTVWGMVDDEEPPEATTHEASWQRVLVTAAVQGAIQGTTRAAVNRAGAHSYEHLTGVWPGEERSDPA